MLRETRHEKLLSILGEQGVLPIGEIAKRLEISQATVRRDLVQLDRHGRLTRVLRRRRGRPTPDDRATRSPRSR